MKKITPTQYALYLYEFLAETKADFVADGKIMDNFLILVSYNKDWKNLAKIITAFDNIYNEKEGLIEACVESSSVLSASLRERIIGWLKARENKEVSLSQKVNADLLGGFKISYQDTIIDISLKTQLKNLKNILLN